MGKTNDNLKVAFAGESQANRKYEVYADKAAKDGFNNIAKLFRATADAEAVHASRHWKALGMVRDTLSNLQDALQGEIYEVEDMYPEFLAVAQQEEEISAQHAFRGALEAERIHIKLFQEALEAVQQKKDIPDFRVYTCEVCGYTHVGDPIERCPVCNVPWKFFHEIL